ncbi:MAG: CoA transferase subunit A [Candidatus Hodarchaeota archaeon]
MTKMIQEFISNGTHLYIEGILVNRLPIAAVHEIIRAQRRELRIVSAPNGLAVDQLIGAGTVAEVEFYFLGFMTKNGFATMRRFRSAAEAGSIRVKESMGYAICMALRAGAYGIPYIPLPDFRGSDLIKDRADYKVITSPYNDEETVITVPALRPDVLLLHAHTADEKGNVRLDEPWPYFTLTTAQACRHVIVTIEEIVKTLPAQHTTLPHFLVDAIAHVPYGAAPTALNHRYEVNATHIALYQEAATTAAGFDQYLQDYIIGCSNHEAFLKKAGYPLAWIQESNKQPS